jgi:hypothetical protein
LGSFGERGWCYDTNPVFFCAPFKTVSHLHNVFGIATVFSDIRGTQNGMSWHSLMGRWLSHIVKPDTVSDTNHKYPLAEPAEEDVHKSDAYQNGYAVLHDFNEEG